jgi:ABC-type hemin transport system substrate-binding protein
MTVGGDTFISDVLCHAGFANVFGERMRYPEVTPEMLIAAQPDVLLLSSEPYPFAATHAAELEAATGIPSMLVDGELCSWYGSRMRLAPPYLTDLHARLAA